MRRVRVRKQSGFDSVDYHLGYKKGWDTGYADAKKEYNNSYSIAALKRALANEQALGRRLAVELSEAREHAETTQKRHKALQDEASELSCALYRKNTMLARCTAKIKRLSAIVAGQTELPL